MRLIDADKLIKNIENTADLGGWIGDTLRQIKWLAVRYINSAPSIDIDRPQEWIPCSERLPKENECVGNVWKYYLIQDEYEDMHVAHLSGSGWKTIESVKALECDVVAWMPLPEPYEKGADNDRA